MKGSVMRAGFMRFFSVGVSLAFLTACRVSAPTTVVPDNWISAPNQTGDESTALAPEAAERLGRSYDQILGVHGETLEGLEPADSLSLRQPLGLLPSAPGECQERWHLGGYMTNVAVTVSGILGSLVGAGTASSAIKWLPRGENLKPKPVQPQSIRLRASATRKEIEKQLEPAVRGALGSGLIRDERKFRSNLLDTARSFRDVARTLEKLPLRGSHWQPDVFRLEMQFDVNGNVMPMLEVGAGVEIRFDWQRGAGDDDPDADASSRVDAYATSAGNRLAERVRAFVGAVGQDLDVLETEAAWVESKGMMLNEIRIGAGFTVQGDAVGFAQATTQFTGTFEFHKHDNELKGLVAGASLRDLPGDEDGTLDLFANPAAIEAFRSAGNALDAESLKTVSAKQSIVVRIKRKVFRKGLLRANRIAAFFASRAASLHVGRWGIDELGTEFDMSLAGSLGIATVGGTGVVELVYENPSL